MEKGFTLVIPLYNKVNVFRNTLESVRKNHGEYPFKCIIVDDDSTDGSSEIAEEYDVKYPDIFMYIKKKHRGHKGPVFARNLGIKLADTQYIGFLDADDELCPEFIDRGCTFLDEHFEYNAYGCGYKTSKKNIYNNTVYTTHSYNRNDIHSFKEYVLNGLIDYTFCSYIYKTQLVKLNLFTDVFSEDVVFKLKYIYNNEPIFLDNNNITSIIWNMSNGESITWEKQNNIHEHGLKTVFDILRNEISDFEYTIEMIDNNDFYLKTIK